MNPDDIQNEYYSHTKPHNPAVKFRDGMLSIQASAFNYCHPKHDHGPYTCFEVAYLLNDSVFANIPELQDTGDDVYGYVDIKQVISLLYNEGYSSKEILKILPR
jgi:hypothetical protein